MRKKILFGISALLVTGALIITSIRASSAQNEMPCPEGYVLTTSLEPIQGPEQSSTITGMGCQSVSNTVEQVMLEPIQLSEWSDQPSEFTDQGEAVNGFVRGPSKTIGFHCVVFLEPIHPGEQFSKASEAVCGFGPINSIEGEPLDSSYLIAKFYNNTSYSNLLVEYYGASACSPTIDYGVADLPDNLDNRLASGQSYSNCDLISVYDFNNYGGPSYSCGANCPSYYALNDEVNSWSVSD